ncbi:MAG: hypothetical protein JWO46_2799 [Nocardioidaceae bacterium]|nr:hypothetical protein [Nocardioidaceae bacterium]
MPGYPVTAQFAGAYLAYLGVAKPPSVNTIRTWVWRGKVTRVGTDPSGYALYDLTDIVLEARRLGYLDEATRQLQQKDEACIRITNL